MLRSIHVENMALIDEADVHLTDGLNILTGETGAGKSIVIGSVGMALGGKASKDMIRTGADYALSELDFQTDDQKTFDLLDELGIPVPDDHIVISRRLTGARSIARINGEMVSLQTLKKAASRLIDIHGQHEHQSLIHTQNHIRILDQFARDELADLKDKLREAYSLYTDLQDEIDHAQMDENKRKSEASFLEFQIGEIDAASLKEGEEEQLDKSFRKMNHARQLIESTSAVHAMTGYDESGSAGELIGRALRQLQSAERFDEGAAALSAQLADIDALLNDFNRDLSDYSDSLTFDEETYSETEKRLEVISAMKSKYGDSVEAIQAFRDQCQEKLDRLNDYEGYLADLTGRFDRAKGQVKDISDQVSLIRGKWAAQLEKKISSALRDLNFLDVRFQIRVEDQGHFSANGRDKVEFMISTNPGEALRPLSKVASGGELSRIMLAIKSVLADTDEIPTLIFDEIDTGISGRTAQMVAEKMALIASSRQVICITHLPQIASMADSNFVIEKAVAQGRTRTQIRCLDDEEAVGEVARLLGGASITDAVLENAREVRRLACRVKESSQEGTP